MSRGNISHPGSSARWVGLDAEQSHDLVYHDGSEFVEMMAEEASVCQTEEEGGDWNQQDSHMEGEEDFGMYMYEPFSTTH